MWVFLAGCESARDSSSFFELERSFLVTDLWITWLTFLKSFTCYALPELVLLFVGLVEFLGILFLAGVTTVSFF